MDNIVHVVLTILSMVYLKNAQSRRYKSKIAAISLYKRRAILILDVWACNHR